MCVCKQSVIEKTSKEFDCAEISKNALVAATSLVTLDGLPLISVNQRVDVKIKVRRKVWLP